MSDESTALSAPAEVRSSAVAPSGAMDSTLDWLLCGADRNSCYMREKAPPKKKLSVYELPDVCRTGDLLLFSTRDAGAKMIQRFTRSKWNHVAMIVRPAPSQTCAIAADSSRLTPFTSSPGACTPAVLHLLPG